VRAVGRITGAGLESAEQTLHRYFELSLA
jgi:hypothetical protein